MRLEKVLMTSPIFSIWRMVLFLTRIYTLWVHKYRIPFLQLETICLNLCSIHGIIDYAVAIRHHSTSTTWCCSRNSIQLSMATNCTFKSDLWFNIKVIWWLVYCQMLKIFWISLGHEFFINFENIHFADLTWKSWWQTLWGCLSDEMILFSLHWYADWRKHGILHNTPGDL